MLSLLLPETIPKACTLFYVSIIQISFVIVLIRVILAQVRKIAYNSAFQLNRFTKNPEDRGVELTMTCQMQVFLPVSTLPASIRMFGHFYKLKKGL